jgi:glucokinase
LPTGSCSDTLEAIYAAVEAAGPGPEPVFGVACGDPLDAPGGRILSPPNLPGWDDVPICRELTNRFGGRAFLMNDANAGALAEWQYGAGRGCRSMVFLTAGTGMGAGLILDGRLYEGATGSAGEVGHVRLAPAGPVGYGKAGSFEGLCSGGGIAQRAQSAARSAGGEVSYNPGTINAITARHVGEAADAGHADARLLLAEVGRDLGAALAILVDVLNPERIVIGSLFVRCRAHLEPALRDVLADEALERPLAGCRIVPADLGERIGDLAPVAVALYRAGQLPAES